MRLKPPLLFIPGLKPQGFQAIVPFRKKNLQIIIALDRS